MLKKLREIGPGALTAAAFIGPGTVTTATIAGAQYGYALVWTLIFATFAAMTLQETAARLGVVGRTGLGEAIVKAASQSKAVKWAAIALIVVALFIGNAAYEGGNIAGAALGVKAALPDAPHSVVVGAIALFAGGLLFFGGYDVIERVLIGAVIVMAGAFGASLMVIGPDWAGLASGIAPSVPAGALPIAIGLIGTTIVPYNLFLHAAAARRKWSNAEGLSAARIDAGLSIGIGGIISILVLATAAASFFGSAQNIASAADLAIQLEPAFGAGAVWLMAAGLFAAGLSSAVTAPLATGFAAAELFGFESNPRNNKFRLVAAAVLIVGATVAITGARPVEIILLAQFANGLLLPVVAIFLLLAANRKALLKEKTNGALANMAGGAVVLIALGLGLRAILRALGVID
ncbi:MAG: Nramp family divalent metal transporter [Pseudomonadota bacterium]